MRKNDYFKGVIENMSKMRMPEMSVVRFTESDVIVASVYSVRLAHFNDGWKSNGTITVDSSTVYGWPTSEGSGVTDDILSSIYYTGGYKVETRGGDGWNWFSALIDGESTNGWSADGSDDGLYVLNRSNNTFERRVNS